MPPVCWKCGAPPKTPSPLSLLHEPLKINPSADIIRLLATNDVPLDAEIPLVRQIISDAQARMRALDVYVQRLQATLSVVTQRRIETAKHLVEHRAILSAVRRLPAELICEILELATAQRREAPQWSLGFISRPWRQYAIGYSPLWSSFNLPGFPLSESRALQQVAALETQLARCPTAPLDVIWSGIDETSPDSRILALILPHSDRWRTVTLRLTANRCVAEWLSVAHGKLGRLEKIEVVNAGRKFVTDIFTTAPNLRHVVLQQSTAAKRRSVLLPWEQVTQYHGEGRFAQQVAILREIPNLVDCALVVNVVHDNFVPSTNIVLTFPNLRRLRLNRHGFLLHIVAPSLEELCATEGVQLLRKFLPFRVRLACTLQKLSLWECHIDSEIITILRGLPNLTHLLVVNGDHDDEEAVQFFNAMKVWATLPPVCPDLESMVYGFAGWNSSVALESFYDMVRSRFWPDHCYRFVTRLNSFRLLSCASNFKAYSRPAAGLVDWIRCLQRSGFDVAFFGEHETTDYLRSRNI
ncbi:hypothetical protein C8R45DRAFT_1185258 [Mycena sanguinolenta]|nr:hypothetical protein C8R45DRAFT_1185258 [Mycena sanguinolenta]